MRLLYLLLAGIFLLPLAAEAGPSTTSPLELNAVASSIAKRQVNVQCYAPGEVDPEDGERSDPYTYWNAWGYVLHEDRKTIHLAKEVCDGALAIVHDDDSVPNWMQALGARVLAHEALHANLWNRWYDEAWVECYALKQLKATARKLGAEQSELNDLLAYSLAEHYRITEFAPKYHLKSCKWPEIFSFADLDKERESQTPP